MDEHDRQECHSVYNRTRLSVAAGIRYLLDAREHDPYGDDAKRLLYETIMKTQARKLLPCCIAVLAVLKIYSVGNEHTPNCPTHIVTVRINDVVQAKRHLASASCTLLTFLANISFVDHAGTYVPPGCGECQQLRAATRL